MKFKFTCPYCGFENEHLLDELSGAIVTHCDSESGGCDKRVVLTYWVEAKTKVEKIVGDE